MRDCSVTQDEHQLEKRLLTSFTCFPILFMILSIRKVSIQNPNQVVVVVVVVQVKS